MKCIVQKQRVFLYKYDIEMCDYLTKYLRVYLKLRIYDRCQQNIEIFGTGRVCLQFFNGPHSVIART